MRGCNGHARRPAARVPAERTRPATRGPWRIGLAIDGGAKLGRGRQTLGIPAQMLASHAHAGFLAVVRQHRFEVGAHDGVLLAQRWIGQPFAGAQIVDRLVEEPRPAVGAAPDHHAVGAGLLEGRVDVVERVDVAVDDHRQTGRRLDVGDERPVGMAVIEIAARAAMHGQHLDAALLGDAREVGGVAVGRIPARAHLERHRQLHRLDRRLENLAAWTSSRISEEPAWPLTTFFTGQPKLMSMIAAPRSSLSLAASAITSGSQPAS